MPSSEPYVYLKMPRIIGMMRRLPCSGCAAFWMTKNDTAEDTPTISSANTTVAQRIARKRLPFGGGGTDDRAEYQSRVKLVASALSAVLNEPIEVAKDPGQEQAAHARRQPVQDEIAKHAHCPLWAPFGSGRC